MRSLTSLTSMYVRICSPPPHTMSKTVCPAKDEACVYGQSSIIQLKVAGKMPQRSWVQFPASTCNSQHPYGGSQPHIKLEVSSSSGIWTWATPLTHSCLLHIPPPSDFWESTSKIKEDPLCSGSANWVSVAQEITSCFLILKRMELKVLKTLKPINTVKSYSNYPL